MSEDKETHAMEQEDVVSNIKTNLTCQICEKLFLDPRILPCLHTFCCQCVETLLRNRPLKDKLFKCPTCQIETGLDSRKSVRNLPANSLLVSLLDLLLIQEGETVECDVCDSSEESSANVRCRECSEYLCELHAEAHKRARDTKQHVLLSFGKLPVVLVSSSCRKVLEKSARIHERGGRKKIGTILFALLRSVISFFSLTEICFIVMRLLLQIKH